MCGIWGYVGSEDPFSIAHAWDGLCSLTDRGPDDWGMYVSETGKVTTEAELPTDERNVVLGNRRLSILDLSEAGNQPMSTEDNHWIVYNGEVYNYRELRKTLKESGYVFESESDTEVILRAYQEYGTQCVKKLRGMFAFAVYDAENGTLFAARDRFGIKPFYYDHTGDHLAFASELTSLLESGVSSPELDYRSVDGFLTFGYVTGPRTIVDGIRSLPAGSTLTYDPATGETDIESYWSPSFGEGYEGTAERVRSLLEESLKLRLRSDVPVGAFLSGGLDSSTIVALMRELSEAEREDLHTFSIGFEHEDYSESEFAEIVAESFGTDHTSWTVTADDIRAELDDMIGSMDQPTIDGVNTYFVSQLAADEGLKVALSGLGSDELFFGYPTFESVPRRYKAAKRLYTIPSTIRRSIAGVFNQIGRPFFGDTAGKVADAISSDDAFGAAYLSSRGVFSREERKKILDREPMDWSTVVGEDVAETLASSDAFDAVSNTELTWYMRDQLLRQTDSMSMTHSLEVRVPFLDSELTEYVIGASTSSKQDGEKGLLKDAVDDLVPTDVIEREKTGFEFPFTTWLDDELDDVVADALSSDRLAESPISAETATTIRERFHRGEVHWSRLWALVVLSLWIDEHMR